jgi:Flp pilus assembly pilin Flp
MVRAWLLRQLYRKRADVTDVLSDGQGLVEYALILMFVAMAVVVILFFLGPAIGNVFSNLIPNL